MGWATCSRRHQGGVFCARRSPAVVHCLGAEVVLKFTPKGGYKDVAGLTAREKGKGRAQDESPMGLPPTEPCAGPSRPLEHGYENQASFTLEKCVEDADEPASATDMIPQYHSFNTDSVATAITDLNTSQFGPETGETSQELVQPKQGRVREKSKVNKNKSKVSVPEISITLVHGDAVVLYGDDFEVSVTPRWILPGPV